MDAWIAGATGLIGRELLGLLLAEPRVTRVTALVRRPTGARHAKLDERVVDFERLDAELAPSGAPSAGEPMAVFCCLGTTMAKAGSKEAFRRVDHDYPLALAKFAERQRAGVFAIVTAIGANPRSNIFYNRVKGEVEAHLRALDLERLRIFQPSLLLGERSEHRAGEAVGAALARPLGALLVGPLRRYRPIRGDTVARAMLRVALDPGDARVRVYASDAIAEIGSEARESG